MNALGWIFMLTSTLTVTVLTFWCFYRVLTLAEKRAGDTVVDDQRPAAK